MTTVVSPDAPNFFILGGTKCGTTTLYHLLKQHPDIFLIQDKETRFFDDDAYYRQGIETYLRNHFRGARIYSLRGEATPTYLHHPDVVAPRLKETFGEELRFLVVLRDPISRAWSHYLQRVREAAEDRSFVAALEGDFERSSDLAWTRYYSDGLYDQQLKRWYEFYAPQVFSIFLTCDLSSDPSGVVRRAFTFLGVDPDVQVNTNVDTNPAARPRMRRMAKLLNRPNRVTNKLKRAMPYIVRRRARDSFNRWNRLPIEQAPAMEEAAQHLLQERYEPHVRELEVMLGRDLSAWRVAPGGPPPSRAPIGPSPAA